MAYRSGMLGCGPRGVIHGRAYEGLKEIRLVAACDLDEKRLKEYGQRFGIDRLYTTAEEMVRKEKLDVMHIVTAPAYREQGIELAARHGVRGIIVEKPLALNLSQVEAIKKTVAKTGIKIAVNMQRRYFESCQSLRKVLAEGKIGDILFVRTMTKGNILSMGPHFIDLLLYFLGDPEPETVWACAYGMNGEDYRHPAPANMLITCTFPKQITAYCEDAYDAIGVPGEENFWQHHEIDFWGSTGRAWWTPNRDWGYECTGMTKPHVEPTSWAGADIPGQRGVTRAMAEWLDNDAAGHLNSWDNSLRGFQLIVQAMSSAMRGERVAFGDPVPADIVEQISRRLDKGERRWDKR